MNASNSARQVMPAFALALLVAGSASTAVAGSVNLVTNGSFEDTGGLNTNYFVNYPTPNLPGWSGGAYQDNDCIVISGSNGLHNCGRTDAIYNLQESPGNSPDGGNYFLMDGDPAVQSELYQTIDGLIIGDDYQLTFYQAAGQLYPYDTTADNNWYVQFGDQHQSSAVMVTPAAGISPWESQTMTFVADSTSAVLGFLAVGTPTNLPPISFLDGVSLTDEGAAATPEPSTSLMLLAGLLIAVPALRRLVRAR